MQIREKLSINHLEEDFIHVMLSAMDGKLFANEIERDTAIKGTCLVSYTRFSSISNYNFYKVGLMKSYNPLFLPVNPCHIFL